MPWVAWSSTSSAFLSASWNGIPLPTTASSRSLGTTIIVSTLLAHLGDAHLGLLHPLPALEQERLGHDADGERADLARHLRDDRRRAGAGAAAHAAGDEDQVGALHRRDHLVAVLLDGLAADLRPRAGAESAGELLADLDLDVRLRDRQRLRVGVDRDELDARRAAPRSCG